MKNQLTLFFENLGFHQEAYAPDISVWEKRFPDTKHIVISDKREWDKLPSLEDGSFCIAYYLDNEENVTTPFMSSEIYFEDAKNNVDKVLLILHNMIMVVENIINNSL